MLYGNKINTQITEEINDKNYFYVPFCDFPHFVKYSYYTNQDIEIKYIPVF